MLIDFLRGGAAGTTGRRFVMTGASGDLGAATTTPGVHRIHLVLDALAQGGREALEGGLTTEALEFQDGDSIIFAKMSAGPYGRELGGKEFSITGWPEGCETSSPGMG
jgi:hypothetical protein